MRKILVITILILATMISVYAHGAEDVQVRTVSYDGVSEYVFSCEPQISGLGTTRTWSIRPDGEPTELEVTNSEATLQYTLADKFYHIGCQMKDSSGTIHRGDFHIDRRESPDPTRPVLSVPDSFDLEFTAICEPQLGTTNFEMYWFLLDASTGEEEQLSQYQNQQEISHAVTEHGLWDITCGVWDKDAQSWAQFGMPVEFFEGSQAYVPNEEGCLPGECGNETIENATLTVDKVVINDDNGTLLEENFTLTIDGEAKEWSTPYALEPGTYVVGEIAVEGYEASISGACSTGGTITLSSGQDALCTITNDDIGDEPPGGICYESVRDLPATCSGGTITEDSWNGCRKILCGGMQILACNKPDSSAPEYFEMYKQVDAQGIEICIHDTCMNDEGYKRSVNDFPICTDGGPVCGNDIIEEGETCDDGNTVNGDGCSATCQVESGDNSAPLAPEWLEPSAGKDDVHPVDFHIQVFDMVDADNDTHVATDFEMWDGQEIVWSSLFETESKTHIHNADGTFEGSLAGQDQLEWDHSYSLRTRFYDDGTSNNVSEWSEWRNFSTRSEPENVSGNFTWTARDGYTIELVASGIEVPVNVEMAPSLYAGVPEADRPLLYVTQLYGKLGMIEQDGDYVLIADNLLNYESFGSLPGSGETGVTGLYVDEVTGDLFVSMVYWDDSQDRYFGKVERFLMDDEGDAYTSRQVILSGIPAAASHQVQSITRGPDGKLYLNTGDSDNLGAPEDIGNLAGKILRFNGDGSIPSDNPYDGTYVYAAGFRNPFGAAWHPETGDLFVTENGPDNNDSVKIVAPGELHGWCCEVWENAWHLFDKTVAPVQLDFNPGGNTFPSDTQNHLYVALSGPTYSTGGHELSKRIVEFTISPDGSEGTMEDLVVYTGDGYGAPIGLAFGEQGLYFSDIYGETGFTGVGVTEGNIFLVKPGEQTEDPLPDDDEFSAALGTARWYPQGLNVVWECKQSNGIGPFTYDYHFGDGSSMIGTDRDDVYHTYPENGTYTASCTIYDGGSGEQANAQSTITLGTSAGGFCGDGTVDSGEQCDDGNDFNGDGCSSACTLENYQCDVQDIINEGETKTYSIDGTEYEVSAIFVETDEAQFSVDGEMGNTIQSSETDTFNNTILGLIDAAVSGSQGKASFCMDELQEQSADLRIADWYPQGTHVVLICEESGFTANSWQWSFGDGGTQTTTQDDVYHIYSSSGTYDASCTATDGSVSASDSLQVTV